MNKVVNRFLLAGEKFMPEMHLREPGFRYNACGQKEYNNLQKKDIHEIFIKTN